MIAGDGGRHGAPMIAGLGQWLPEAVRTNAAWPAEFAEAAAGRREGRELVDASAEAFDRFEEIALRRGRPDEADPWKGAVRRRVADDAVASAQAEAWAGEAALAAAGLAVRDVDLVLSWAMVPDRLSPANAPRVAHLLGTRAPAIGVEAACASVVAQLSLAAAMVESGRARTVLCTQSHLMTRACALLHPASPLMGDMATAFVVRAAERPGVTAVEMSSEGEWYEAVTWCRGRDEDPPWWSAGGAFVPGTRDRQRTHALVRGWVKMAVETIEAACARARVAPRDLDALAIVQPRWWLPGAVCEAMGLPEERAPLTWSELAHVGGCGVVANLLAARERGLLREGSKVALYGVGAGVTRAAAVVEWRKP